MAEHVEIIPGLILQMPTIIGQRAFYTTFDQRQHIGSETHIVPHLARVVETDEDHDVTILEIDTLEPRATHILIMNDSIPVVGREVFVCGNPGVLTWVLTSGIISSVDLDPTNTNVISFMASVNIFYGNSGSAIVNSRGEVLGIADAIFYQQSYLGTYVPIRYVLQLLLEEHRKMSP